MPKSYMQDNPCKFGSLDDHSDPFACSDCLIENLRVEISRGKSIIHRALYTGRAHDPSWEDEAEAYLVRDITEPSEEK